MSVKSRSAPRSSLQSLHPSQLLRGSTTALVLFVGWLVTGFGLILHPCFCWYESYESVSLIIKLPVWIHIFGSCANFQVWCTLWQVCFLSAFTSFIWAIAVANCSFIRWNSWGWSESYGAVPNLELVYVKYPWEHILQLGSSLFCCVKSCLRSCFTANCAMEWNYRNKGVKSCFRSCFTGNCTVEWSYGVKVQLVKEQIIKSHKQKWINRPF